MRGSVVAWLIGGGGVVGFLVVLAEAFFVLLFGDFLMSVLP